MLPTSGKYINIFNKMKHYIFLVFFLFVDISLYAQICDVDNLSYSGNIQDIIERFPKYRNSWQELSFDSLSRIKEKKYYRDGCLIQVEEWNYQNRDSILILTEKIHSIITNQTQMQIHKYYYDSEGILSRYELYSDTDATEPTVKECNTIYKQGKLMRYDRILLSNGMINLIEHYELTYSDDNRKIVIQQTDDRNISHEKVMIYYDKRGKLMKKIVDYNDRSVVLSDVIPYAHNWQDKYVIKYDYDKSGNWIKSYFITRFWKYKKEEREIKYR